MAKSWRDDPEYKKRINKLVDNLFERAFRNKWTYEDFAREAGLSGSTVRNLGKGKTKIPSHRTVERLALALGGFLVFGTSVKTLKVTWAPEKLTHKYAVSHGRTAA